ncbi:MAG: hypothetical protein ACRD4M_13940 [Candidatus Acidiferrales bacterium]
MPLRRRILAQTNACESPSQFLTLRGLTAKKKRFRILPFAAHFERPKILIPWAFRRIRLGFAPKLQLIQVFGSDLTVPQTVKEMVAQGRRQTSPLNFWHLFAEGHTGKLSLDAFPLGRVLRGAQQVRKFKEFAFLIFLGFDAAFNQPHQHAVCAGFLIRRERSDAASKTGRKRHALAHRFLNGSHC